MSASLITKGIGVSPDISWTVGERRISQKGELLEGTNQDTYWSCALDEIAGQDLYDSLLDNLTYLHDLKPFFKDFNGSGGYTEYFVGIFVDENVGVTIDQRLVRLMSSLKIALALDIYSEKLNRGNSELEKPEQRTKKMRKTAKKK